MKVLVFSDIHGSAEAAVLIRKIINKIKPDRIILLGDLLHGASEGGSEVPTLLRRYANIITAVRGNGDYESDEELLLFSLPRFASFDFEGHSCHLSHHPQYAISFPPGDIVMNGHTHVKKLESVAGVIYLNPGSCALPRDECTSYALLENGVVALFRLSDMKMLSQIEL